MGDKEKQKVSEKASSLKNNLIQRINKDAYIVACREKRENEFLDEFARIGYYLYLRDRNNYPTDLEKKTDIKEIVEKMEETAEAINFPVYLRKLYIGRYISVKENVLWIGPLIAELYDLKSDDVARLTIKGMYNIDRNVDRKVKIYDPNQMRYYKDYSFSTLGGIWVYPKDVELLVDPEILKKHPIIFFLMNFLKYPLKFLID